MHSGWILFIPLSPLPIDLQFPPHRLFVFYTIGFRLYTGHIKKMKEYGYETTLP